MDRNDLKHGGRLLLGIGGLLLCFIFAFGWGYFYTGTKTQYKTQPENTDRVKPQHRKTFSPPQETLKDFQSSAFYRTIVDNNLFRPLGWTPPRPRETYRLLGTLLPTDANTPKQACLHRTTTGRTDTVRIGDKLDADTTLVDIHPKQVTLETDGHQRTLKLNTDPWIK